MSSIPTPLLVPWGAIEVEAIKLFSRSKLITFHANSMFSGGSKLLLPTLPSLSALT